MVKKWDSLQEAKHESVELEHSLSNEVFSVDFLHQFVQSIGKRPLLGGRLNNLPNAVGDWSESRVQLWLQTVGHNGVQCGAQIADA